MKISNTGHLVFETTEELNQALNLARAIHLDGFINTKEPMWELWLQNEKNGKNLTDFNVLLIWTAVFLPSLQWSIISLALLELDYFF